MKNKSSLVFFIFIAVILLFTTASVSFAGVLISTDKNTSGGMLKSDIITLQKWLIFKNYSIPAGATGTYGPQTTRAVAAYQSLRGIVPAVGYFGPKTRNYVNTDPTIIGYQAQATSTTQSQNQTQNNNNQNGISADAQRQIDQLKQQNAETQQKQQALEQKISTLQQTPAPQIIQQTINQISTSTASQNITITAADINPYLTGVGRIDCYGSTPTASSTWLSTGSGSIWNVAGFGYSVLTNNHVIDIANKNYCKFLTPDNGDIKAYANAKDIGYGWITGQWWWLDEANVFKYNKVVDEVLLKITKEFVEGDSPDGLNASIGQLPLCPKRMALNSPLVMIGFPASTMQDLTDGSKLTTRTVTNGVISAYDESTSFNGLPAPDYFVSAKIDHGNSGGIALAKDSNGLCVLGIPTKFNIGSADLQGIVVNIYNIIAR